MRAKLRQHWYRLRDRFRDAVWAFAGRIDPAVAAANLERMEAFDQLQRYAMAGTPRLRRLQLVFFASAEEVAEAALRKADAEGFDEPLAVAAERAKETV